MKHDAVARKHQSEAALLDWHGLTEEERAERTAHLHTPEARRKKSASMKRWWSTMTPEERRSAASARNIDAAARARFHCGGCKLVSNGSGIARHERTTGHTGRTRVA
jgi:hypothetical protein